MGQHKGGGHKRGEKPPEQIGGRKIEVGGGPHTTGVLGCREEGAARKIFPKEGVWGAPKKKERGGENFSKKTGGGRTN